MLDLTRADPGLLHLADAVVTELLATSTALDAAQIMIVGAHSRDIMQSALGHGFGLRATTDIDLGLAISNWPAYGELVEKLPPSGNTGIQFRIANVPADLMPFGDVEDPRGTVTPPARNEPLSVWGFAEVFAAALPLTLPSGGTIKIPTVAGYAALKLAAWLDRSEYNEFKDAIDIATVLYWYAKSPVVNDYVYESEHGQDLLLAEDTDDTAAAVRVLGEHLAAAMGPDRLTEITERWLRSAKAAHLYDHMTVTSAPGWPRSPERRRSLIQAMERGMGMARPR
ncbi:hypothetical protein ACTI_29560 [Actinoplanes sp. OR16]|uniref:hypothetical protein n=1 Tax=Actinoplanes sp. OR16 TaxID=946334 RepID=UPI000F6C1214|nr:hypothetical protein [Actinoplanes sp. OR16]BBH66271.1 hypothetical protein ACTI_29560 [Actinoplanes sp. OR16]